MGTYRTDSERRRAARFRLDSDDRPTLFVCPSCDGKKKFSVEVGTRYREWNCKWCFASGAVDYYVMKLFNRWLRLRNWNRDRCSEKSPDKK